MPDGALILRDKHGRIMPLSAEPGHRISANWMGSTVLTLEDLLRPRLRVIAVGINPAPVSVACGHYYQGRLGQRFFGRLRQAGLMAEADVGLADDVAFASGIGFTDVIKRPTASAAELRPDEWEYGRALLEENVRRCHAELLVFAFRAAATALFGQFPGNGFVPGLRMGPSEVFVMPSPYGSNVATRPTLEALAARIRALG